MFPGPDNTDEVLHICNSADCMYTGVDDTSEVLHICDSAHCMYQGSDNADEDTEGKLSQPLLLVSAGLDKALRLWDPEGLRQLRAVHKQEGEISAIVVLGYAPSDLAGICDCRKHVCMNGTHL